MGNITEALLDPEAYPHKPEKIELLQTQMSFLFLAGEYVYKIKKPVNLGYLDYTTLEKRHYFCRQELELNKRLCAHAYLAVVPIVERGGKVYVEKGGRIIEYAVKMRRLPGERMMDALLLRGQLTVEMVTKVAERLADFHQKAETNSDIAAFGELIVIRQNCEENFSQTEKYVGISIPETRYERIKNYTKGFMRENADLFEKRVRDGKIKDCHGDVHAAHICFLNGICVYDCIEFNQRFRYCDVASELAFLAMDLDRYRRPDLSRRLVDAYLKLSGDEEVLRLLNFYKCYRAYVRGKVESFKLDDPLIPQVEKARALESAQAYFALAESYC